MKTYYKCLECCFRSYIEQITRFDIDPGVREDMTRVFLAYLAGMDYSQTPPYIARFLQKLITEKTGIVDPYKDMKTFYNRRMIEAYGSFRESVDAHHDPVGAALKLAVSGNIIDVGPAEKLDIEATIEGALSRGFAVDHSSLFFESLRRSERILYLADNAGEIVLDRLLIETLINRGVIRADSLTLAVRGAPVQNDATMAEASEAGLPGIIRVIDNGDGAPGTILEFTSAAFREEFEKADMIISKGQGNYETLCGMSGINIFFLLITKCSLIADRLDVPMLSFVCLKG